MKNDVYRKVGLFLFDTLFWRGLGHVPVRGAIVDHQTGLFEGRTLCWDLHAGLVAKPVTLTLM